MRIYVRAYLYGIRRLAAEMICDCGHKDETAHLTTSGLLCTECWRLKCFPDAPYVSLRLRRSSDEIELQLKQAHHELRKKLPQEWDDEKIMKIARRMVRHREVV